MGVLTRDELKNLAKHNNLLGKDHLDKNFQPSSYDLRIGTIFQHQKIYNKNFKKRGFCKTIIIKPSEIVTFLTLETVTIPLKYMGTVFPINSQSSSGLLILNPGHIDPGFSGTLSICAVNLSKEDIRVNIGDSIFTLIIDELTKVLTAAEGYQNIADPQKRVENFNKNTALKLSDSFFDLMKDNKDLVKMIRTTVGRKLFKYLGWTVAALATIATIWGSGISTYLSPNKVLKSRIDSLKTNNILQSNRIDVLQKKIDSLAKLTTFRQQEPINKTNTNKTTK